MPTKKLDNPNSTLNRGAVEPKEKVALATAQDVQAVADAITDLTELIAGITDALKEVAKKTGAIESKIDTIMSKSKAGQF